MGIAAMLIFNPAYAAKPKINFNVRAPGFQYGTSVRGNPLTAYKFGEGTKAIWFVAGLHGNEKSSSYLAVDLANYLADNLQVIPADRRVIIIPAANPDGFLRNSRANARGIDLNRNFGASDWRRYVRKGRQLMHGGQAAFSEREAQALRSYMELDGVEKLVALHAQANIVNPERTEASKNLAKDYAYRANYPYLGHWTSYPTSGTLTLWAEEHFNAPAITVELPTYTNPDWHRNLPAILHTIQH